MLVYIVGVWYFQSLSLRDKLSCGNKPKKKKKKLTLPQIKLNSVPGGSSILEPSMRVRPDHQSLAFPSWCLGAKLLGPARVCRWVIRKDCRITCFPLVFYHSKKNGGSVPTCALKCGFWPWSWLPLPLSTLRRKAVSSSTHSMCLERGTRSVLSLWGLLIF